MPAILPYDYVRKTKESSIPQAVIKCLEKVCMVIDSGLKHSLNEAFFSLKTLENKCTLYSSCGRCTRKSFTEHFSNTTSWPIKFV